MAHPSASMAREERAQCWIKIRLRKVKTGAGGLLHTDGFCSPTARENCGVSLSFNMGQKTLLEFVFKKLCVLFYFFNK